ERPAAEQNDRPGRSAASLKTRGQLRIITEQCMRPDEYRIVHIAFVMDIRPSHFPCNPPACAILQCQSAVRAHRTFQRDVRPTALQMIEKLSVEHPGLIRRRMFYMEPRTGQYLMTAHFGIKVSFSIENIPDPCPDDRIGARRCFPVMGTRLQRHVDVGTLR